MHNKNPTLRLIKELLKPTAVGIVVYIASALIILLIQFFPSVQHYLGLTRNFNPGGIILNGFYNFVTRIFGSGVANNVADFVFWLIVGLLIYIFINTFIDFVGKAGDAIQTRNFISPVKAGPNYAIKGFLRRVVYHLVTAVGLIVYFYYVVIYLLRLSAANSHPAISDKQWLSTIIVLALQCLSFHGVTIILRLLIGRSRLLSYNWEGL